MDRNGPSKSPEARVLEDRDGDGGGSRRKGGRADGDSNRLAITSVRKGQSREKASGDAEDPMDVSVNMDEAHEAIKSAIEAS